MFTDIINKIQKRIILTKVKDYKNIEGWLSDNEAIGLFKIAKKLRKNAQVVEIGSWQGKSTYCLSKGLADGTIYAIDPFNADGGSDANDTEYYLKLKASKDLFETFKENLKSYKLTNIIAKKGYSHEFVEEFQDIDFLFIDGDHSIEGCKKDYDLFHNKIKSGGFIGFHDYYADRKDLGPVYVINEIINKGNEFTFYKQYDSLWIAIKK